MYRAGPLWELFDSYRESMLNLNVLEFGTDIFEDFLWLLTQHNPVLWC